jgi:hypothetical protein
MALKSTPQTASNGGKCRRASLDQRIGKLDGHGEKKWAERSPEAQRAGFLLILWKDEGAGRPEPVFSG